MSELDNLRIFRARLLFENNVPDHTDDVFDELNKIYKNINLNTSENEYEINIEDLKYGDEIPKLHIGKIISETNDIDEITLGQMWDVKNPKDIIEKCKYSISFYDSTPIETDYTDRAGMLMDLIESMLKIYSECRAVYFENSGKLLQREQILNSNSKREERYISYSVNVRYFSIPDTGEMIIDTLGMSTLLLPDLQYHFKVMNPNYVFSHAYNLLQYIYNNRNSIHTGETVDGILDYYIDKNVQWECRFEDSLLKPLRPVIDVNMGDYAAGKRQ